MSRTNSERVREAMLGGPASLRTIAHAAELSYAQTRQTVAGLRQHRQASSWGTPYFVTWDLTPKGRAIAEREFEERERAAAVWGSCLVCCRPLVELANGRRCVDCARDGMALGDFEPEAVR